MPATATSKANAYTKNAAATASPVKLLLMLLDRLCLDIERGARALVAKNNPEANKEFVHAQAIVAELLGALDPTGWKGGPELQGLYTYLNRRLIVANVRHDTAAAREALVLARHITDTWKMCAAKLGEAA